MKIKLVAILSLMSVYLLSGGCDSDRDFDSDLRQILKPYHFRIARWEFRTLPRELNQLIFGEGAEVDDEAGKVMEYYSSIERIKAIRLEIKLNSDNETYRASLEAELEKLEEQRIALEDVVEKIIEKQVREVLSQEGIYNPLIGLEVNFPPLNFELEKPPNLLVISPRDRIESMREFFLVQEMSAAEMEAVEAQTDELGVSSLVVGLGGIGATYPTFVTNDASLSFTIDAVAEEWLHQYLAFKPLGFLYVLDLTGISRDYDIAAMNETLASMVSTEIGAIVYEKYYSGYENGANQDQETESEFDFNREMREIRRAVDKYLEAGQIEEAEMFMEQKRQYLASEGYYIRKLNQAYFAFHGTYTDSPTSVSPIGVELRQLRSQSASLKDFLNTVAAMTNRQELRDNLEPEEK